MKESVSIFIVMRLKLAKNRGSINELMSELHSLRQEMANVSEAISGIK